MTRTWRGRLAWVFEQLGIVLVCAWILTFVTPLISDVRPGYWHFIPPALAGLALVLGTKALIRWARGRRR